jgi:hypothetical protein
VTYEFRIIADTNKGTTKLQVRQREEVPFGVKIFWGKWYEVPIVDIKDVKDEDSD